MKTWEIVALVLLGALVFYTIGHPQTQASANQAWQTIMGFTGARSYGPKGTGPLVSGGGFGGQ